MPTYQVVADVVVPEGTYRAKLKKVEEKIRNADGEPFLRWVFEVTHGKFAGQMVSVNSGVTFKRSRKEGRLVAGLTGRPLEPDAFVDTDSLEGMECQISVEHTERNGITYTNVANVSPILVMVE